MFGRKRPIQRADNSGNRIHHRMVLRQKGFGVHAFGLHQIEVDVAIPDMPERGDADPGDQRLTGGGGFGNKFGNGGERNRDIVLDGRSGTLLASACSSRIIHNA